MNMMSRILDSKHYMKVLSFAQLQILIDHYHLKEFKWLMATSFYQKNRNKKKLENKNLNGKMNSKQSSILICQQQEMPHKQDLLNFSNLFLMLLRQDNHSQLSEILKENNAVYLLTQLTNMHFQLIITKDLIPFIVFSQKVPLKEFGNYVLTLM